MKLIDELERLIDNIRSSWENEVATLEAGNGALQTKIDELEAEAASFGKHADALHDAICEGRRQDAIDIINAVTGGAYRSVAEQRNLFGDRVPA